jgi:carbamoyl-phosphate synthase large subunit
MPNVLICSAGRRNYLVRWFREAVARSGDGGRVVVADANPLSPAQAEADHFELLPAISDGQYTAALEDICVRNDVALALSLNDFELSQWARGPASPACPTTFIHLAADVQEVAEDKLLLAEVLRNTDFPSPPTVTARQWLSDPSALNIDESSSVVLKNRFGSGSKGLRIIPLSELRQAISERIADVHDQVGARVSDARAAADALVVQPLVPGVEYGVDVVCDFNGVVAAPLARRKLAMRHGETDSAVTVEAGSWHNYARQLTAAVPHRGIIDTDVIEDSNGRRWTIDVNPRFGGGYPFSHLAGADVPRSYLSWLSDAADARGALEYAPGVYSSKSLEVAQVRAPHASPESMHG